MLSRSDTQWLPLMQQCSLLLMCLLGTMVALLCNGNGHMQWQQMIPQIVNWQCDVGASDSLHLNLEQCTCTIFLATIFSL